ncbi:MAG: GTPase [Candidatus Pacearchaeota archaeon]
MVRIRYSFGSRHTGKIKNIAKQRKEFPEIVNEVIRISDIILEVLDCRFINKTRNLALEECVKWMNKKIIFVLNKADLVEINEIKKSIKKEIKPFVFVSSKNGYGAKDLRNKIKIEAKRIKIDNKERIQIGIIGYPNTGKSSLINLLARKGSAKISKQAGFTKGIQKIRFTKDILLLDTPGVIPNEEYSASQEKIIKHTEVGARTFSDVKNPEEVVAHLIKDNLKVIEKFYNINSSGDPEKLIEEIGKKKNLLRKKGEVDTDRTSRKILRDWQEGKITPSLD